jgi:hypothetical protein
VAGDIVFCKRKTSERIFIVLCLFGLEIGCCDVHAQQTPAKKPLMLVTWFGPGGIALPAGADWKPNSLTVYDSGKRPVAQFSKGRTGVTASFILFENLSGDPTAKGCRKDAIDPIMAHDAKLISKRVDGETRTADGLELATTSYLLDMSTAAPGHHQESLFGFAEDQHVCAEIHISSVRDTSGAEDAVTATLAEFHPDLTYRPGAQDYFTLASILFKSSPGLAAPYYKSTLDAMPKDASFTTPRRVATDQLVMSLGLSGDLKNSRAVAESAIASDPDYPLNYYNLACADAEEGNAAQAKIHLQQAFEHRANVLNGESMPDPSRDDSILKLKKDKAFWAFVQSLNKQ